MDQESMRGTGDTCRDLFFHNMIIIGMAKS